MPFSVGLSYVILDQAFLMTKINKESIHTSSYLHLNRISKFYPSSV